MQKEENNIKAIVFDIDGVLIYETGKEARKILAKRYNFDSKKLSEFWKRNSTKSCIGKLHYKDFFKKFVKQSKIRAKPEDLIKSWFDLRRKNSKINKPIERLIKNLRKRYILVALTNSTLLNDKVKLRTNYYKLFNLKLISYKIGVIKPQLRIYKLLIKQLKKKGISPKQAIFIDNESRNLIPAKKLRIKTILFKNNNQLIKDLKKFGIKVK